MSDQIMSVLMGLNPKVCLRFDHTLPEYFLHRRLNRWYVDLGLVVLGDADGSCSTLKPLDGPTPELALQQARSVIRRVFRERPTSFFIVYSRPHHSTGWPGSTPQAWVRWDEAAEEWFDVVPWEEALQAHKTVAGLVVLLKHLPRYGDIPVAVEQRRLQSFEELEPETVRRSEFRVKDDDPLA